ncbi:hypothetical protein J5N97_004999 [Dioscorea zingiberensis]|uniref:Protein kinase domain-containing protein n=1 Tax=Dioscorea zingiberensis TaxID=325984 RepID=A0A9D5HRU3_9LILI|nr:hypothetical protein J5N97_004999 [Dioscorea zingiberensis]
MAMEANPCWNIISISISISIFLILFHSTTSEQDSVKLSLISFLQKLSRNDTEINQKLSWNISSDPCTGGWTGVTCNSKSNSVRIITLQGFGLSGSFDPNLVCNAPSLAVLSLSDNHLHGQLPLEISSCTQLTHLFLSGNQLSGQLPSELSELKNLKRLDISKNNFSGDVPSGLTKISGLVTFLAEDNQLTGSIPAFDFDNLQQFNVSNNLFSGAIPRDGDLFSNESFFGNSGLCGQPLAEACAPAAPPMPLNESSPPSIEKTLMYLGYILLGLAFLLFFLYKFIQKKKKKRSSNMSGNGLKVDGVSHSISKNHSNSSGNKSVPAGLSEYSTGSSTDSALMSTSLVVLKSPAKRSMRFDDLLKSPAELMGRGRNGSVYKVMTVDGSTLVVKRIKEWMISSEDFRKRMELIDRAKHRNVLPLVAFYCSKQEKLLVYEFQHNGSLLKLIHGSQDGRTFDWGSRLNMAAGIAEGMSFMHGELQSHGIGHGNLKSSNIIMNNAMDPCISEYGLMSVLDEISEGSSSSSKSTTKKRGMNNNDVLKKDVYGFGNILLELLTGKLVENNGADLAKWVNSVVREEWTVEVFDKALVEEGASEERMVHLLQVALNCVSTSLDARPTMAQVSSMISSIKEEEERSGVSVS